MRAREFIFEAVESYGGIDFDVEIERDEEGEDIDNIYVKALSNGRELGHVLFTISYDSEGMVLNPQDLEVEERYRGQGIASTMYDYMQSKGYRIRRSGQQTDAGAGMWEKHKPGKNIWEQGVAEDSDYEKTIYMGEYAGFKILVAPHLLEQLQERNITPNSVRAIVQQLPKVKDKIEKLEPNTAIWLVDKRFTLSVGIRVKSNNTLKISTAVHSVKPYLFGGNTHTLYLNENFADGKVKGKSRPGRVKRSGVDCSKPISKLRKIAKNSSGEKQKMAHWCANMKSGRNKK